MDKPQQDKVDAYAAIVAKAWSDPAFKAKLIADPYTTFKEAGLAVHAGVTLKVVENTEKDFYVVLPPKATGELSEEMLDKVAGGDYKGFLGVLSAGLPFAAMLL